MSAKRKDRIAGELRIVSQYGIKLDKRNVVHIKCPHCLVTKPITDFGFRSMGESVYRNQPWCTDCRNL